MKTWKEIKILRILTWKTIRFLGRISTPGQEQETFFYKHKQGMVREDKLDNTMEDGLTEQSCQAREGPGQP